ncbi:RNA methyltransferase, TrmH family [Lactobacillus iners LactinV 03V1-b]|nr:RNA methyltransferase, TrmH family [Lactobacillus iners LactinV 03V1-b]
MDMKEINSVNNSIIKQIRKLKQKKYRKDQMSYLIEGFHLVKEALDMEQKYEYVIGTQETINKLKLTNKIFDKSIILVNQAICDQLSDTENSQDIFMVLPINQPHSFLLSLENGLY